jgi:exodeoxyribonuclease VII large subunit
MENYLRVKKSELGKHAGLLDAVSPLAILARGYAIVQSQDTGEIIRAAEQAAVDDRLRLTLHKGTLDCRVTQTSAS